MKTPKGTYDILPSTHSPEIWQHAELRAQVDLILDQLSTEHGYRKLTTPIFEETALFDKSGEDTDIVQKEMYKFTDKGNRSMTLRPEITPATVRALLQHRFSDQMKGMFYYNGPAFRYERPQSGRYRQFHQYGVEVFGDGSALCDTQVISYANTIMNTLCDTKQLTLMINTLGDTSSRKSYREALTAYFNDHKDNLSEDSQKRLTTNPLRILDSKHPNDKALLAQAPHIHHYLSDSSREHFDQLQQQLAHLNIPFKLNAHLVRGLDYYTDTVFEITHGHDRAQNSILGGGRYDGLVQSMGGPSIPAVGFAFGIERLISALHRDVIDSCMPSDPLLMIVPIDINAQLFCLDIAKTCSTHHIRHFISEKTTLKKMGNMIKKALKQNVTHITFIGSDEANSQSFDIKELATKQTQNCQCDILYQTLTKGITP